MKVLVYGWFGHSNAGDELFKAAFKKLFPWCSFSFVERIDEESLREIDWVFFGGGSFLDQAPRITKEALGIIRSMPLFYVGIGSETSIHSIHMDLLKLAKVVAIRSSINLDAFLNINPQTIVIPDLVYALTDEVMQTTKIDRSILMLPNISVLPRYSDPYWQHVFWHKFKVEMGQFLDGMIENGYQVSFFAMCRDDELNDMGAIVELANGMKYRRTKIIEVETSIESLSRAFGSYECVITQRYHGKVLADMCSIPCITIAHHDKLLSTSAISYFEFTKKKLLDQFGQYNGIHNEGSVEFGRLIERVENAKICRT